jgi:hypothetical protein
MRCGLSRLGVGLVLSGLLATSSALARTGNETGNGGSGVVCPAGANGDPWDGTVRLLDLWEAGVGLNKLTVPRYVELRQRLAGEGVVTEPVKMSPQGLSSESAQILNFMAKRLTDAAPQYFGVDLIDRARWQAENFEFVPDDAELTVVDDFTFPFFPKNCRIGQIANNLDFQRLFVDRSLFSQMDPMHQAALFLHESVYYFTRTRHPEDVKNSDFARRLVGATFSTLTGSELKAFITAYGLPGSQACLIRDAAGRAVGQIDLEFDRVDSWAPSETDWTNDWSPLAARPDVYRLQTASRLDLAGQAQTIGYSVIGKVNVGKDDFDRISDEGFSPAVKDESTLLPMAVFYSRQQGEARAELDSDNELVSKIALTVSDRFPHRITSATGEILGQVEMCDLSRATQRQAAAATAAATFLSGTELLAAPAGESCEGLFNSVPAAACPAGYKTVPLYTETREPWRKDKVFEWGDRAMNNYHGCMRVFVCQP